MSLVDIARSLGVPEDKVIMVKRGLNTETKTHSDALYEILESWRGTVSKDAKLSTLVTVLDMKGLKECSG